MDAANPYQTPRSDVRAPDENFGEVKILSLRGRLGRLRFFMYGYGVLIFQSLVGAGLEMAGLEFTNWQDPASLLLAGINAILVGALLVVWVSVTVQRLHDFNAAGRWALLIFLAPAMVPILASISVWLVLLAALAYLLLLIALFMPGTEGTNRFGPEPPPNILAENIVAGIFVTLLGLGIAAFVIALVAPSLFAAWIG